MGHATLLLYRSFRDLPGGTITLISQRQGWVIPPFVAAS
jgi:hypothetical protein